MRAVGWHPSAKFHIFSIPRITGYYSPGRLWRAGTNQDTDLSCHAPIDIFCCTMWSQSRDVIVEQTNVMLDSMSRKRLCSDYAFEWTNVSAGVRLRLKGRAKVRWSESSGSGKNRRTTTYRAEESYIEETVYLYGSRESSSVSLSLNSTEAVFLVASSLHFREDVTRMQRGKWSRGI